MMSLDDVKTSHQYYLVFEVCYTKWAYCSYQTVIEKHGIVVDLAMPISGADDIKAVSDEFDKGLQEEGKKNYTFVLVNIIRLPV